MSARFTSFVSKLKKEGTTPKEEKTEEEAALKEESTPVVASEAPKLEKPTPAEPLKIEEVRIHMLLEQRADIESKPSAPPAASIVSATA